MSKQLERTVFDEIVEGTIPAHVVWEDDSYMAFLTPWPSTPGLTVVIPRKNPGVYVFDLDDKTIAGLMQATKKVAKLLEKAFNTPRVAMVFEGEGVAHVHAKLYPMHGIETGKAAASVKHQEFYPEYPGYISTAGGPQMSDKELTEIQQKIQKANKQ